jgi:hypothetical protein
LSLKRRPRNEAEARAWLKQLASNLRDIQKEQLKAFRPTAKTARHAVAQWIEPLGVGMTMLRSDLATWFIDAVEASDPEEPTEGKRRARSLDVALGLKPPVGHPRGMRSYDEKTAINIYDLRRGGASWLEIANRLEIDDRIARRVLEAHADAIVKHRISFGTSVPLGYDIKGDKLVVNKSEAATVRMIFERYAQLGSAPMPKRALVALMRKFRAEGITDKRGKPIDKACLYRLLNDRVYTGKVVHKGKYRARHKAIVDPALWLKVHRVRRALTTVRR